MSNPSRRAVLDAAAPTGAALARSASAAMNGVDTVSFEKGHSPDRVRREAAEQTVLPVGVPQPLDVAGAVR